ncbi:MAG: arsenate reductase ArsC [Intrasporangiaceae bacterium]|nr:arsenate reductase ArsC [Intrasporangiaceae bacterium]
MNSPSVLFVCVKNGGKSQMAAALMRQMAGESVTVHSARMRLIREDITRRVTDLALELTGQPRESGDRYRHVVADLVHRFEGVFSADEVRGAVRTAHAALVPQSRIPTFLPVLVERFAKELLVARAQASGAQAKAMPELLFVCLHNAGRSQLAAALARHLSGGRVNVRSAGSRPVGEINPRVLEVLAERGVPAPDAYPKPLTVDVLLAADVVVTMGCGDECPHYPGRRYEDWPVSDPEGADLKSVRAIADDIQIRVTGLLGEVLHDS